MEDDNQEYFLYKIIINIFEQAIIYLSINPLQFFTTDNMKHITKIMFSKSYEFNSS